MVWSGLQITGKDYFLRQAYKDGCWMVLILNTTNYKLKNK